MNSTKIMKSSARPIVLALVLMNIILVGAITVFQEHNTLKSTTFITNQSLKIVMATVRFDNVSESVRNFPNVLVSTLDFVSFEYNVTDGRLLVETWVRGSKDKHKHLFIHNGHNLVLTDTDDLTGVDVYLSEYGAVDIPKGYSLTTMY
ncbi:hypothetical protein M758_2G000800 [Ceratodon purpureus]|uniref:Uncharacterized protein n=1 Tax=Ceratodon purpureus TaxID=3225 RepID=A0A8T0IR35_CERPU|nr:hypothetical protein KC19_2G001000 [Ceratodon purpureus]KAG0624749.1 hypothetical protein M758_2G000800 [Ceratodon purpureus]